MKKIKIPVNGFILGLIASLLLAYLFPEMGAKGGYLRSEITTKIGVIVVFLLQGVQLPSERILKDLLEWKLHLFVQSFNFILIPLLVFSSILASGHHLPPDIRIGFLYLAILPTTVSTAVVFSGIVGGNQTGAIFNAALSNVLAVFIVPAWTTWHLSMTSGVSISFMPLLLKLTYLLILPLLAGQVLRIFLKERAGRHKTECQRICMGIIFFILFAAFSNSFERGVWSIYGFDVVIHTFLISLALLLVVLGIVWTAVYLIKFEYPSRMTALFCASQKSLATGVPMATSIFAAAAASSANAPELGIVLLPLMFYHPLQLFIGGFIVGYFADKQSR